MATLWRGFCARRQKENFQAAHFADRHRELCMAGSVSESVNVPPR
jgi:hypothetical protein